ncbi:sulfotransferase domain-containing protein [Thiorhodococcus mannitoliphagus]|uniref:Sulfotransferase domain-containing protein n=1 Tax=Thiorhodococcus mannitoliphagus TaxID=329406 RepID=A0A6P1E307_9GAMM|nr:sulfotransferase domain-containing protein [Thiorhodococcus mannitoliphagus]NEX23731.1 sulfotransferase domain-containing protein [Thiorhodococcus mannitoliphagus]
MKQRMIGVSSFVNHFVASRFPKSCPFILVCEFPRSGANWIRDMIGDALQLPVPRSSLLPITFSALVHSHFPQPVLKGRAVYVVRDGRDVLVSHYYKTLQTIRAGTPEQRRRAIKLHPSMGGVDGDIKLGSEIRAFYDEWKCRPLGSRVDWGEHVKGWLNAKARGVVVVRYERMLEEPNETLRSALCRLGGEDPNEIAIDFAVQRNTFESKTGRAPGQVDNNQNRRSGQSGGWREALPPDIQARFLVDFGDALDLVTAL